MREGVCEEGNEPESAETPTNAFMLLVLSLMSGGKGPGGRGERDGWDEGNY